MKLSFDEIKNNKVLWEKADYRLPKYDIAAVHKKTEENPQWIHMGAGNIFRSFIARIWQQLLNDGTVSTGIVAAEGFDYEIITKMYRPFDDMCIDVTLKSDGTIDKEVIASVGKSVTPDIEATEDWKFLKKAFSSDSLQMVSFTITEKGYSLVNRSGEYMPAVKQDMENGPAAPVSYLGKIAALLHVRYAAGEKPIAMVSMDNCSRNGEKLENAVLAYAKAWVDNGKCDKGFYDYLTRNGKVTFPWSMIDKITPRPDSTIKKILEKDGLEDMEPIITSKNTYIAPYVNAEETEYLVIEDTFPNGRPPLEKAGVYFADRETVDKSEKMKVGTCLNPIHTAMAIYGCLLGFTKISDETKDKELFAFAHKMGIEEGLPAVIDPGIISPKSFIEEFLNKRLPNPFMPDTPQRIATDTSQKLSIRFGDTVKTYIAREDLDVKSLKLIPLVFAGWCRYLMEVDDKGQEMPLSSDPMLPELLPHFEGVELGKISNAHDILQPILSDERIFGVDLYTAGLGELVEKLFTMLSAGTGAVRNTLIQMLK